VDRDGRECLIYYIAPDGKPTCKAPTDCGPPSWHKGRNVNQSCPKDEPKGNPNWKPDKFNWGNTDPKKGHLGYCYRGKRGGPILGLGGAQCCYVRGKLNQSDEGSYDYIQPGDSYRNPRTWGHILVDVIPAIIWGN
jgi:hypothetical protein